jgi:hypothetical protein
MESSRGKIAFGDWLRWYGGVLALALVVAVGAHVVFGIHPLRAVFGYCGLLFAAAALDKPGRLFLMLRNARWFSMIEADWVVRWWLVLIAFFLLAWAMLLPGGVA